MAAVTLTYTIDGNTVIVTECAPVAPYGVKLYKAVVVGSKTGIGFGECQAAAIVVALNKL